MSKRWEYITLEDIPWDKKHDPIFNKLGKKGWELVAVDFLRDKAVFKRETKQE